jgi:hypothetical protein
MEGREKPHVVKYKAITNDWNYDASCTLTSLPVWDSENFKRLVFVVQSVQVITNTAIGNAIKGFRPYRIMFDCVCVLCLHYYTAAMVTLFRIFRLYGWHY